MQAEEESDRTAADVGAADRWRGGVGVSEDEAGHLLHGFDPRMFEPTDWEVSAMNIPPTPPTDEEMASPWRRSTSW